MDTNKKPPIAPEVLASMAEKLNFTPDNDPLLSQKSPESEETSELDEAVLVDPEPESDTKIEDDSRIKLPVGSFPQIKKPTVQPWANMSAARIGFVVAVLGTIGTGMYTFANSRSSTQEASTPKPSPSNDPVDPNEEKIRVIQKDKTLSDVRSAMGDQANSMSDSKDKKLPTEAEAAPSPTASPSVAASPTAVASPSLTSAPTVKATKPVTPSILPSQPVAKTPTVSSKTSPSKQQTIASLGNRKVSTQEKLASDRSVKPTMPAKTTTIATLGNRSNQTPESVAPVNPQDLGSVGASGNITSNVGSNQPSAPAQLASNNTGGNASDANRAWGLNDQGVPSAQTPALQSGQNSQQPNTAPTSQAIYTPPSLTDYFRDSANGNNQAPSVSPKTEEQPQILTRATTNPNRANQPLELVKNSVPPPPSLNPGNNTNLLKAEDKIAQSPAAPTQNPANRLFSVGTSAKALTLMPIIYGNKVQNVVPKYEIALVEPMIDKISKVGFPMGTRFIVTPVGAASDIGEIQLEVITVKLPTSQEFTPPAGSIVVRAENGGLLLGEDYFNRSGQIAGRNFNRVILGGLATVGSNANRPTVSISTIFGGAGSATTNNAEPNFWLSLLEGSAKEGLSIATEENQAAIKEALAAPKVFKLSKDLKVQVYTNSTIVF
jgi:hypothetical protein